MKREEFLARHTGSWNRLEDLLRLFETPRRRQNLSWLWLSSRPPAPEEFDTLYRLVCRHLALARHREYGEDVIARLNGLALRAYRHLYSARPGPGRTLARFLLDVVPATIVARWRMVAICAATFFIPLVAGGLAVHEDPFLARAIHAQEEIRSYERMYDPSSDHFARERASDTNLAMFGYYIANNVGLAFQTFAWGVTGGVGSLFVLMYNGLALGAVFGHLTQVGYGATFYPFVAGHAAFELTGIVVAGTGGLTLGWSILSPGRLSRAASLRQAARDGATLVSGAFALLVLAAFVEAYWSPRISVPAGVKYAVGSCLWVMVSLWLLRAGRRGS
ncbi:MAG: stage II sporulation protein M [Candidatus Polarisedimenticolia bacterium]